MVGSDIPGWDHVEVQSAIAPSDESQKNSSSHTAHCWRFRFPSGCSGRHLIEGAEVSRTSEQRSSECTPLERLSTELESWAPEDGFPSTEGWAPEGWSVRLTMGSWGWFHTEEGGSIAGPGRRIWSEAENPNPEDPNPEDLDPWDPNPGDLDPWDPDPNKKQA